MIRHYPWLNTFALSDSHVGTYAKVDGLTRVAIVRNNEHLIRGRHAHESLAIVFGCMPLLGSA